MSANPYAVYLGDRQPEQVIAATAARLSELVAQLGAEGVERALAPGKWSARQIVCHLADCEIAFAFRLRQVLSQDNHVIQPFDQDRWAAMHGSFDTASALAVFRALREWNIRLLANLPAGARERSLSHPERGPMTFQTIVETMAGHDTNHLKQIERIAALT